MAGLSSYTVGHLVSMKALSVVDRGLLKHVIFGDSLKYPSSYFESYVETNF